MFARLMVTTVNKTDYTQPMVVGLVWGTPRGNEGDLWNCNLPLI
jgi:hypothetical protein